MKSGKVWGETELVLQTPFIEFHRIWVHQGGFCSLHKHEFKWNMFYVTSGELAVHIHKSDYELIDTTVLGPRQWTTVKPGEFHSFEAVHDTMAFELYYPEPLSEDIIRKTVFQGWWTTVKNILIKKWFKVLSRYIVYIFNEIFRTHYL